MFCSDLEFVDIRIAYHNSWVIEVGFDIVVSEGTANWEFAWVNSVWCLELHTLKEEIVPVESYGLLVNVATSVFDSSLLLFVLGFVVSGNLNRVLFARHDCPAIPNISNVAHIINEHYNQYAGSWTISCLFTFEKVLLISFLDATLECQLRFLRKFVIFDDLWSQ